MNDRKNRSELDRLADAMADDVLHMSDEELRAELKEDGESLDDLSRSFESAFDAANMKSGINRLADARTSMAAAKKILTPSNVVGMDAVRRKFQQVWRSDSDLAKKITKAARNGNKDALSDEDMRQWVADFERLGFPFNEEDDK